MRKIEKKDRDARVGDEGESNARGERSFAGTRERAAAAAELRRRREAARFDARLT